MTWDNGDRTVLVNPNLGGMTIGWKVLHNHRMNCLPLSKEPRFTLGLFSIA